MSVQCELCPKYCIIKPGQSGNCRVRINIDEKLTTVVYGFPCAVNIDPVEKKPLFHFLPGTKIFSIATVGCNLHCLNCQNWEISQANPEDSEAMLCLPETLLELTQQHGCPSLAYTYTDPIIYYEYTYDSAKLAHEKKIRNVLVTAGYINPEPWKRLLEYTDAAKIDLKGITDEFYRDVCSASLQPVLDALIAAKEADIELEVTNLIIPTLNDKPAEIRELVRWIKTNLGNEIPLHFSRFFPKYKLRNLPPTPPKTLDTAYEIAKEEGMHYVYIGNILSEKGQNTYCPACNNLLIERSGYTILQNALKEGGCPKCGKKIYGVWK